MNIASIRVSGESTSKNEGIIFTGAIVADTPKFKQLLTQNGDLYLIPKEVILDETILRTTSPIEENKYKSILLSLRKIDELEEKKKEIDSILLNEKLFLKTKMNNLSNQNTFKNINIEKAPS